MSKFKRVISGLVGVAIAASMFTSMPFSVFAEDKTETNNQTYVYDDYEVSELVFIAKKWYNRRYEKRISSNKLRK